MAGRRGSGLSAPESKPTTSLSARQLRTVLSPLEDRLAGWAKARPGERPDRQPVHTVYGGADLFSADLARKLGDVALRTLRAYAPDPPTFADVVGLPEALAHTIHARVVEKLEREPVEDFRIDFEDGYGERSDEEEDRAAVDSAAQVARGLEAGTLPPFVGIRIKPLNARHLARGARTLDLFVTTLARETGGRIPPGFVVTLPKVVLVEQVTALVDLFETLEAKLEIHAGTLRLELMIETPQSLIGPDGRVALPGLVDAAQGRCAAAHFGVYDHTASLQITAAHQTLDHPACDFARHLMQTALNGTGVWLSDGATNVLPAPPHRAREGASLSVDQERENREAVHRGWRLHADHVRHSLRHAFYQGWDLHPAQLPTRYATLYGFFLDGLDEMAGRLRHFLERAARATLSGDVFDDAATGQALLNHFLRGMNCGAITEEEAVSTGLAIDELRTRSFGRILEGRR
ncbi:MAG TPA: phosphoenolpyruvate kinase [Gemmatimonadota bacterium]|nr:phosphoenolpyruvate kinase [Gemmatimonadota bacterium]